MLPPRLGPTPTVPRPTDKDTQLLSNPEPEMRSEISMGLAQAEDTIQILVKQARKL